MHLYIYCDTSKLENDDIKTFSSAANNITEKLTPFIETNSQLRADLHKEIDENYVESSKIGIDFHVKKAKQLELPLNFFNQLAKEYKQDFVLGLFTDGKAEDVCFFGFEEGLGDSFMISQYINL